MIGTMPFSILFAMWVINNIYIFQFPSIKHTALAFYLSVKWELEWMGIGYYWTPCLQVLGR